MFLFLYKSIWSLFVHINKIVYTLLNNGKNTLKKDIITLLFPLQKSWWNNICKRKEDSRMG